MSSGAQLVLETGGLAELCSRQQTHTVPETHCAKAASCASYKPQRAAEAKEKEHDKVCVRLDGSGRRANKDVRRETKKKFKKK